MLKGKRDFWQPS